MWAWVIVVVCYLFGAGFFFLLGGFSAAADALQRWGRSSASTRGGRSASS